ncbi:hypothetical protein C8J57DRAFT_1240658 [Mycena rebaudengoi]|nr:hypothetical protein C8J57DRAFT_1240658 [Mycena rebaudengoi]
MEINLRERMKKMLERLQLVQDAVNVQFGLPVWHTVAHDKSCQARNSLSYVPGVGRTDGEGMEWTWLGFNPLAWATKEMDKINHHNFEKNLGQGDVLPWKLILAINERDQQVTEFEQVDATLNDEVWDQWQAQVDEWILDRSFCADRGSRVTGVHERGREGCGGQGEVDRVELGMQLEKTQFRIHREAKAHVLLMMDHKEKLEEMCIGFLRKLRKFCVLQEVHMPGAINAIEEEEKQDLELPPPQAEHVKLWLPSDLSRAMRVAGCRAGMPEREAKLREAQCGDMLALVQSRQHVKHHLLNHHDDRNVVGQRVATWWYMLIGMLGEQVTDAADRRMTGQNDLKSRGAKAKNCRTEGYQEDHSSEITSTATYGFHQLQ